jgi:hypothetical protein
MALTIYEYNVFHFGVLTTEHKIKTVSDDEKFFHRYKNGCLIEKYKTEDEALRDMFEDIREESSQVVASVSGRVIDYVGSTPLNYS